MPRFSEMLGGDAANEPRRETAEEILDRLTRYTARHASTTDDPAPEPTGAGAAAASGDPVVDDLLPRRD